MLYIVVICVGLFLLVPIYAGLYIPVLRWLGVNEKLNIRSLYLSLITVGAQFGFGLLSLALSDSVLFGNILSILILMVIFKKFLVMKTWLAIVIPIVVSMVGSIILAVILLFVFRAIG